MSNTYYQEEEEEEEEGYIEETRLKEGHKWPFQLTQNTSVMMESL